MVDTKKIYGLSEKIQAIVRAGKLEQAVELIEEFLDLPGADRRWGLSMLQSVIKDIRERGVDPDTEKELREQEKTITDGLLEMDADGEGWMHRWERARQLNNKAWADLEAASSPEELEAALASAVKSLEFWPYFLPHIDTKVRCLLKLGRKEEAFRCVRFVDAIQPEWPDFEDIWPSTDYRDWLKANRKEPVELPEGPATLDEVLPRLESGQASPAGEPLNDTERMLLRGVRYGHNEWLRARNAALVAVILDDDLPVDELLSMGPQAADLTQRVYRSDKGEIPLGFDSLAKLRHWLIYGSTNHPSVHLPNPPPGIKVSLFINWDLKKMSRKDVDILLGEIGEKVGIEKLDTRRCRPPEVAGYKKRTGFVRKPTK
jgi:hypothetical protein